jgi:hypothetical protein
MNVLLYRYVPALLRLAARDGRLTTGNNEHINEWNEYIQREQSRSGAAFVSRTILATPRYGPGTPIVALRAVLMNPATELGDIDMLLDEQVEIATRLECGEVSCRKQTAGKVG